MYYWLERETQLLKELGDYKVENQINSDDSPFSFEATSSNQDSFSIENYPEEAYIDISLIKKNNEEPSLLHEQVFKDQRTFQEKISRLNKRKEWLKANELLLRTFLSYCSLHSASGGNDKL